MHLIHIHYCILLSLSLSPSQSFSSLSLNKLGTVLWCTPWGKPLHHLPLLQLGLVLGCKLFSVDVLKVILQFPESVPLPSETPNFEKAVAIFVQVRLLRWQVLGFHHLEELVPADAMEGFLLHPSNRLFQSSCSLKKWNNILIFYCISWNSIELSI